MIPQHSLPGPPSRSTGWIAPASPGAREQTLISAYCLSPRHQYCKNDRHEEERGYISYQMAAFGRIVEGLSAHDRPVNHARPHGEPDNALVRIGVSRCDEEKYAQCRIHSDDHHQIVRISLAPSPARGPHNAQCIYAKYKH